MMKIVSAILFGLLLLPVASPAARQSPVDFGVITSGVGWRLDPFGSGRLVYHSGYDIAVPTGTPVHPTQVGTVFFSGPYYGYGNLVGIDHGNGYLTFYGHNSALLAKPGEKVNTDTVIALSGNTGRSTGPHLHYEMRRFPGYRNRPGESLHNTAGELDTTKGPAAAAGPANGMGGEDDRRRCLPELPGE
jgi:murein DD-endopeptidase MepM/ murein hydrolase activator NlpD